MGAGSSPLARGLLLFNAKCDLGYGIIPARAGFTYDNARDALDAQDHPRSRGVYGCLACSCVARAGSSPLARGLQNYI